MIPAENTVSIRILDVIRRIFGSRGDDVAETQRKLHNEKLHNLYPSPGVIRTIK
jgi:hypothetical protein